MSKGDKERTEEIARMIHPHDDKPDPTAHIGNYNFPQLIFAFLLGLSAMFLLSIDEIQDFKGCTSTENDTYIKKNE